MSLRAENNRAAIAYGLQGDVLRHVSEVQRGLACDCCCVRCRKPLVARQGDVRTAHFAHQYQSKCDGGVETILHRLAKELLACMTSMSLPAYLFSRKAMVGLEEVSYSATVRPEKMVSYMRTEIEPRLSGLIPDLVIWNANRRLIVEVAVTHQVDELKLSRIAALDLPALEIRLSPSDACSSREELRTKLANDLGSKHWLFHPNQRAHERKFIVLLANERNRQNIEDRARRISLKKTLSPAWRVRQSATVTEPSSMREFLLNNAQAERFFQRHGRYPSLSEMKEGQTKLRRRDSRNTNG